MSTHVAGGAHRTDFAPSRANHSDPIDVVLQATALVVALEDVLLAARRLLEVLSTTTACPTGAAPRTGERIRGRADATCDGPAGQRGHALPAVLSRREAAVLRRLASGHSNQQIAQALYLSPRTVQRHVANLYLKIGAHYRAEATAYARRHRLA